MKEQFQVIYGFIIDQLNNKAPTVLSRYVQRYECVVRPICRKYRRWRLAMSIQERRMPFDPNHFPKLSIKQLNNFPIKADYGLSGVVVKNFERYSASLSIPLWITFVLLQNSFQVGGGLSWPSREWGLKARRPVHWSENENTQNTTQRYMDSTLFQSYKYVYVK